MSAKAESWQEQCNRFFSAFGIPDMQKRFVVGHDLTERQTCSVDIQNPEFAKHAERQGCETQSAYGIEYIPEKRVLYGELLVGHCPTRKEFQSFLLTPGVDVSKHCEIEQVHIHTGKGCPTTHIHLHCEIPEGESMHVALSNIAWIAEKLDNYMKATCE